MNTALRYTVKGKKQDELRHVCYSIAKKMHALLIKKQMQQGKGKDTKFGKEEIKLFAYDMTIYIEKLKKSTNKLLQLISKFSQVKRQGSIHQYIKKS